LVYFMTDIFGFFWSVGLALAGIIVFLLSFPIALLLVIRYQKEQSFRFYFCLLWSIISGLAWPVIGIGLVSTLVGSGC